MPGPYCTLQGFVLNTGLLGNALWTFVVAVHTFFMIAGSHKVKTWVSTMSTSGKGRWIFVAAVWAFIVFMGCFGLMFLEPFHPERGPYCIIPLASSNNGLDNNSGAGWCWIDQNYFWERIFFFYCIPLNLFVIDLVFVFVDMFGLSILYIALFFYLRFQPRRLRQASTDEQSTHGSMVRPSNLERGARPPKTHHTRMKQVSFIFIWYPVIYILCTMPLSVSRISEFANKNWGLTSVYVGGALYDSQGWINVLLYAGTRKGIISWGKFFDKFKRKPAALKSSLPHPSAHHPKSISIIHMTEFVAPYPSATSTDNSTRYFAQGGEQYSVKSLDSGSDSKADIDRSRFEHVQHGNDNYHQKLSLGDDIYGIQTV